MQLTQDQWYDKIKAAVPTMIWGKEKVARAYFRALAKVAVDIQTNINAFIDDTYISRAKAGTLDTHGTERAVERVSGEVDAYFAPRVQAIVNTSNIPSLESAVNQLLLTGACDIVEDMLDNDTHNAFTVQIPLQNLPALTFADRGYFMDVDSFAGVGDSIFDVIQSIKTIIDTNKALGTVYRVVDPNGEVL